MVPMELLIVAMVAKVENQAVMILPRAVTAALV
jgi:hypothetical protein